MPTEKDSETRHEEAGPAGDEPISVVRVRRRKGQADDGFPSYRPAEAFDRSLRLRRMGYGLLALGVAVAIVWAGWVLADDLGLRSRPEEPRVILPERPGLTPAQIEKAREILEERGPERSGPTLTEIENEQREAERRARERLERSLPDPREAR
jgi:hypothetical protein